jgi:PAS domain S-box-containing protein
MLEERPEMLHQVVVDRWLRQLQPSASASMWSSTFATGATVTSPHPSAMSVGEAGHADASRRDSLFYQQLAGILNDGIVFTDAEGTITQWNVGMQRLTSIAAEAIVGQTWINEAFHLRAIDSSSEDEDCLVRECLASGTPMTRSMQISQPGRPDTPVQLRVTPVTGVTPGVHGAVVVVRDLSDQANLQEKLEDLHLQTTRDPLTGIANRAHFDHVLADLTAEAIVGGKSFSLIMCDIDHFKRSTTSTVTPPGTRR